MALSFGVAFILTALAFASLPLAEPRGNNHGLNALGLGQSVSTLRRSLNAAAQSACVWATTDNGCYLKNGYVTSFTGTPTTESQKLLARGDALAAICEQYKSNITGCALSLYCAYESSTGKCSVTNGYINVGWLRGVTYCSGSLADTSLSCQQLTSQAACSADTSCKWVTAAAASASGLADMLDSVASWEGAATSSSSAAVCWPAWSTDSLTSLLAGVSSVASGVGKLAGNCSAGAKMSTLFSSCNAKTTQAACVGVVGCEWSSNSCDVACNAGTQLLLDAADTWVQSYRNTVSTCAALTNATACASSPTFVPDASKLPTYAALQPTFSDNSGGGGGGAAASTTPLFTMVLGLLVSFVCIRALLQ